MATILRTDGTVTETRPADGREYTLTELQAAVGGYIEALRTPDGRYMFLNEDGKRLDLPLNELATELMRGRIADDDYIVGDVILCTLVEAGGEF